MRPGSWLVAASFLAAAAHAGTAVTIDDEAIECRLVEIDAAGTAHFTTADDKPRTPPSSCAVAVCSAAPFAAAANAP
jgi:hypothetical protein